MAYKGKYMPSNKKKYVGNLYNITYRSLWERKFMVYCDRNESILAWASEEIYIHYISPIDNKIHRYFPDFFIKVRQKDKSIKNMLIEIKPKSQTEPKKAEAKPKPKAKPKAKPKIKPKSQCLPPKIPKRKTKNYLYEMKTWSVNQAKWKAATEWCEDRKYEFKLITENELGI